MTSPLRILLLEDDSHDAELIQELLEADHFVCEIIRAQTRAEFVAGLENIGINLILADYKLPSFDGFSALTLARYARADLPFIFVSGSLGEEVAIEAVKNGATDYVVKSRLSRLVPSVHRALREAQERAERKKAEESFRRSEMYLAEAQRLSHTGSFGWEPASGKIYWSSETYRIFECEPTIELSVQMALDRVHPDDRTRLRQILDRASIERTEFIAEHRLLMADGSVKYVRVVAHPSTGEDPERFVFVGAVMDITERNRAEEALRTAQAEVVRVSRLTTMGELVASIAHEINQPIAAMVTNAEAAQLWLNRQPPHMAEARQALARIVKDGIRAGDVIGGIRELIKKAPPRKDRVDLNEAIREVIELTHGEAVKTGVSVRMQLATDLPLIHGDRVQLQQVFLNLIINAVEAMGSVSDGPRELLISTAQVEPGDVLVEVRDSGPGFAPATHEHLFEAFYTTKLAGLGMGLSICRSIIEAHGGRVWAEPNQPRGTIFQILTPAQP